MSTTDKDLLDITLKPFNDVFNLPDLSEMKGQYAAAQPFSHVVIDKFFQQDVSACVDRVLVSGKTQFKVSFNDDVQANKTISTGDAVPEYLSLLAAKFAAPEMLEYLEALTGLKRLVPDPYYNTKYGYYHIVGPGGKLGSHVDHSHHQFLNIPHVLNLVIYLTADWNPEDGGALCLYDPSGKKIMRMLPSLHNRAVIFASNPIAFHGVEPIRPEADKRRHSLYFAYYSVQASGLGEAKLFPAHFDKTRQAETDAVHGTYFVMPFWDLFKKKNRAHLKHRLGVIIRLCLPPLLFVVLGKLRKK